MKGNTEQAVLTRGGQKAVYVWRFFFMPAPIYTRFIHGSGEFP